MGLEQTLVPRFVLVGRVCQLSECAYLRADMRIILSVLSGKWLLGKARSRSRYAGIWLGICIWVDLFVRRCGVYGWSYKGKIDEKSDRKEQGIRDTGSRILEFEFGNYHHRFSLSYSATHIFEIVISGAMFHSLMEEVNIGFFVSATTACSAPSCAASVFRTPGQRFATMRKTGSLPSRCARACRPRVCAIYVDFPQ